MFAFKGFLIYFASVAATTAQIVSFDLSSYDPLNSSTYSQSVFLNLSSGTSEIEVVNLQDSVQFFVIQVHTFLDNITLSSTAELETQTFITGTNVGLVGVNQLNKNLDFYLTAETTVNASIIVVIYDQDAPIPGGCNLSFDIPIAPYQLVSYTDELITVLSQAPASRFTTCEKDNVDVDLYHLYLRENDLSDDLYFDGLRKMTTVDEILKNGYKVTATNNHFKYNKLYNSYRGVGHVFAIIATYKNKSSAYVPAISYGCDVRNASDDCYGPITPHWKLLCAVLLIFGFFTCYFGHKFFRITIYMIGLAVGVFITYIILSLNVDLSVTEKTTTSVLIGLIYASVWLTIWWKFGIPILSISLTFFMSGLLVASIIFYAGVADLPAFHNDVYFWLAQFSVILAFFILCAMFTLQGHIFACSFLGSYACMTAVNYYTGGNLQYIMINSFRRIAINDFNMATIDPPFQILDACQVLLWIVIAAFGYYHQRKEHKGRPPFPPSRYTAVFVVSETTPLLPSQPPEYVP